MNVLIAEDEVEIANGIKFLLEKNGFLADVVHNGEEALDYIYSSHYDIVILDIMMPKKNGIEVLRRIRESKNPVPVLLLTAKGEVEDRVLGLDSGADDYLAKPFATVELIARVKALSRRSGNYTDLMLQFGDLVLNCNSYEISCNDNVVRLNNKEYQLAELFLKNPKKIYSVDNLIDSVWGLDNNTEVSVVWTTIGFLRKKIKNIGSRVEVKSVRGAGYILEDLSC